ncbi:MAG: aminopeptidase P family protein [Treponema sp.]|jgi:Xaa-Pro aminopeptidase|nr:aminopeptidase P family protein [Treponema sp.]
MSPEKTKNPGAGSNPWFDGAGAPAFPIREMQQALCGEGLDGWLFCNFRHRDRISDEILGIDPETTNSRLWLYVVPARGEPLGIVHAIEKDGLRTGGKALPGAVVSYRSRAELLERLRPFAGKRWGAHFSEAITAISFLDAGTAALLERAGLSLVSAEGLLQRFKGLLDPAGIEAHEKAAGHLYEIVRLCWDRVRKSYAEREAICEGDIQELMLEEFGKRNLVTDHARIVAAGKNSANPHYDIPEEAAGRARRGERFAEGDVIQFDLWARDPGPGGIYADISWVGVYAEQPAPHLEKAFAGLVEAREGALRFIGEELEAGRRPAGADIDRRTREILAGAGFEEALRHRTGHGIDTEVHGSGVNIDSVEFPDTRLLLDGACFSLEPGIYFPSAKETAGGAFGMRTEIDVYIKDGKPVVSGDTPQFVLLHC